MKEFKTFRDLEFKRKFYKYNGSNVHKARMTFDNDYGISVIHDDLFTSSSDLSDERLLRLRKSFVLENLLQFGQTHGRDLLRGDG